jgi:hypothetical protein
MISKRQPNCPVGDAPTVARLLTSVAFWQGMMFFMLVCMIWVNEVLDLPRGIYNALPSGIDYFGAGLLSSGIVIVGFITTAHTYLLQQRILRGIIVCCSYCNKVRVEHRDWQEMEHYVSQKTLATFSHGVCPDCYGNVREEMDTAVSERQRLMTDHRGAPFEKFKIDAGSDPV